MENNDLRKRLYQNLSHRTLKHTFLLQTEMRDPKSPKGVLKPKILQSSITQLKNSSNSFLASPKRLKSGQVSDKKLIPSKVEVEKLSKQAKTIVQDGKNKIKSNLKPAEIFAFYDAFPEMIEDFFYLNRLSHPYDYQIVSYAKRNSKQYMTISSQGVTLYHEKEAEFLTRQQWLQDQKIYYQLQKIDFFSQYKLSKNFIIWKYQMKSHYMKSMSNILSEKLFLTSAYPRNCLVEVCNYCMNLQDNLILLPPQHIQSSNWKDLIHTIYEYLSNSLVAKIAQHQQLILKSLQFAIDLQIKSFKQCNRIKIDGLNNQEQNKEGYIYSQEAILRKQYKRVLKLIKLTQCMLLQSKVKLIKRWMNDILEKLQDIKETNFRDEWLTIHFIAMPPAQNSDDIVWNPSYENFINIIKMIIDKAIEQICKKHERITNNPIFEKYRNSEDQLLCKQQKNKCLKNLIEESSFYKELTQKIKQNLQQQFKHVVQQQKELRKYIDIYKKHKNMPPLQCLIKESTVDELEIYVHEWKEDNEQMKDMPDKCIGMIKFDYSLIRKEMMNVAENSCSKLFTLLPIRLGEKVSQLSRKTSELDSPLDIDFEISIFVQFTKAAKRASDQLQTISEEVHEIKRLEALLAQNKGSSLEAHKNNLRILFKSVENLTEKVKAAQINHSSRSTQFKKKNDISIKKIKENVKSYLSRLEQIEADQKHLSQESILQKLSVIQPIIGDLYKQAINIKMTQNQLGLPETDFSQARTLYQRVQVLCSLWNQKKLWRQFQNQLLKKFYEQMDCEKEMITWNKFNEQITKIKHVLDQNSYMNDLVEEVQQTYNEIQLVRALQSKSLNQKSWVQISEYLSFQFDRKNSDNSSNSTKIQPFKDPKDRMYTVQWLRKNKVSEYKQRIQQIVKKSEKQTQLINTLSIIKSYINSLSLKFVMKKRELTLLGDNNIVFQQLEEHLTVLVEIFNQQFSQSLKKQTKSLVKHYEYVIEILQSYRQFGSNWEKYEQLFDSGKHYSKQLNKQAKDFLNLQATWKKLIKSITIDNWSKRVYDQTIGASPNRNTMKAIHKANAIWQQIKKGIEQFLDKRRNIFHHYYYFSDEELISLMAKTDSNLNINSVVSLIYQNIKRINVDSNGQIFISVFSKDGEQLKINKAITVKIGSQFEEMLKFFQEQWKKGLSSNIKKTFSDYISISEDEVSRVKVILENATQVVLAFDNMLWTKLGEDTYLCPEPLGSLGDWIDIQNGQIGQLKALCKKSISEIQQRKIEELILQSIYLRDKTEHFLKNGINSSKSYEWIRTLKLCDNSGSILLKAAGSSIPYGGEFYGPSSYFYIAPETERSYLNLMQLINDREVGVFNSKNHNLESIKYFTRFVAQNFKVFGFCPGVSLKMIDRIFTGVCYQGAWSYLVPPNNYQIISLIASHISTIQKCIKENCFNTQIYKLPISINQQNLPIFFLRLEENQGETLKTVNKLNFRCCSLVAPSIKTLLEMRFSEQNRGNQKAQLVSELVGYCKHLFEDKFYDQLDINFAISIARQLRIKPDESVQSIRSKLTVILNKKISHKLRTQDELVLQSFIHAFKLQSDHKIKSKKPGAITYPVSSKSITNINQNFENYDDHFIKNANTLFDTINGSWETGKNIILAGSTLCGKNLLLSEVKKHTQQIQGSHVNMFKVYFLAYKQSQLLSTSEKGPGIIAKSINPKQQNWVVLDGPLNQKYEKLFSQISNDIVLSNYGVIKNNNQSKNLKFILKTTSLGHLSPNFTNFHSIVYLQQNEKSVENMIRQRLTNYLYRDHEQQVRQQLKGDQNTQINIKSFKAKPKSIRLPKDILEILIIQLVGLVEKLAPKGSLKLKTIDFLYQISKNQLAYKCCRLVEGIFSQNWDTINEKINKKSIQRFVAWVVMWSLSTVVSPDDIEKLERTVSEMTKSPIFDGLLKSIVFPGSGIDIYCLNSTRVQNALSCIPKSGEISNIVNKFNSLFENQSSSAKNKFQSQFHLDYPHRIRVITEESAYFSYIALLNRHANIPIAIYGPPSSGKKSIIDIFNKKNKDSIDSHSVRFKKFDPYFIIKQIQKPFIKLNTPSKLLYKPYDISKRIHISIDDLSMTPYHEPSTEFLRMIANENCLYDERFNEVQFRQLMLTITVNQIKLNNLEDVDFTRVLSRLFLLQTSKKTKQNLSRIFTPMIENIWFEFLFNGNLEKIHCFINKNRQNIVINSTLSIYSFIDELANQHPSNNPIQLNKKLLLTPRIQQICNVIGNLCQVQDSEQNDMGYYAEFWVHEMMRVFGDKLTSTQSYNAFFEEIKKSCLIQFKHSITNQISKCIFSNVACQKKQQDQDSTKSTFLKYNSVSQLRNQLQKIYCRESEAECLPLIAEQFTTDLIKIYRVLKMAEGNILIVTPLKKAAKYLVKIANIFLKGSIFNDVQDNKFDFDVYLSPSILKEINCCLTFDIQTASQQLIYLFTSISNRNVYDFEIGNEIKQKLKTKFISIAQDNWNKQQTPQQQAQLNKTVGKQRTFSITENQDSIRLAEIQSRIQLDFMQIITDSIHDYIHIATFVQPHKIETTKIISQNMSLIKNMQICWLNQYKQQTLTRTSKRILQISQGSIKYSKQFINRCKQIYDLLSSEQKSQADFAKYCESCYRIYENLSERINSQIGLFEECLKVIKKNSQEGQIRKQKLRELQDKMQEIAKNQQEVSLNIKKCQQEESATIQSLELQMKRIKSDKQSLDLKCREARNSEKLSESLSSLLPNKLELQQKLARSKQTQTYCQQYCILVQSALLFLNNANKTQYMRSFNEWANIVKIKAVQSIEEIFSIFQKLYGIDLIRVPGWHKFSTFTQLKGFHFCENFKNIPESVFGMQPIGVQDKQQTIVRLLSAILHYYNTKLITHICTKKQNQNKRQQSQKNIRKQFMANLQKQIIKAIGEQKEDCRNQDKLELRNGVIIVGENYKWQPTRNDIQILQKKVLKQRRYVTNNRIIIIGSNLPNITFYPDNEDLKYLLIQKSMQIQFGDTKVNENNRFQTLLRQITIIVDQKRNCIIQKAIQKQSEEDVIKHIEEIESQLIEIDKNKKRMENYIGDNHKIVNDEFLIDWLLGFASSSSAWTYQRVLEIYEFLKRCLMQLNYPRQQKIDSIQKVEPSILKNWQNLIRTNLNQSDQISLSQIVSLSMPLSQTTNLVLLSGEGLIEQHLSTFLTNCPYSLQYVNMHMSSLSSHNENLSSEHENKKKLYIFQKINLGAGHINSMIDFLERNKSQSCPVAIIISNECQALSENSLLKQNYRIIIKSVHVVRPGIFQEISSIDAEDLKEKKNSLQQTTRNKKISAEQEDLLQASHTVLMDNINQQSTRIRQAFKKFFTIIIGAKLESNNTIFNIPLKAIVSRIKIIKGHEQIKQMIKDFMFDLPQLWLDLLSVILACGKREAEPQKIEQIQNMYNYYYSLIQSKNKPQLSIQVKKASPSMAFLTKSSDIQQIISQLPFSFNCQDFKKSNEPIVMWLVEQANILNNKKFALKKYLNQCIKISKGNKLSYWTHKDQFGLWIPRQEQINRLYCDFKTIKKSLQLLGIAGGLESSTKDIKPLSNQNQSHSILSIACQSIDMRDYEGFSNKIILFSMIKASKKLKLSLSKLKISWKFISPDAIIEEPVNGQNCLTLNANLTQNSIFDCPKPLNMKQLNKTKLLMMIYDSSPLPSTVQPISKQCKKQKTKKKTEQTKSAACENQINTIQIAIKLKEGQQVGNIGMPIKEECNNFRTLIKQPHFKLF